jgi:hypothetical protein
MAYFKLFAVNRVIQMIKNMVIDYKDLFKSLKKSITDYTEVLMTMIQADVDIENRLIESKERLETF